MFRPIIMRDREDKAEAYVSFKCFGKRKTLDLPTLRRAMHEMYARLFAITRSGNAITVFSVAQQRYKFNTALRIVCANIPMQIIYI